MVTPTSPIRYPFLDEDFIHFWQKFKDWCDQQGREIRYEDEQDALNEISSVASTSEIACKVIQQAILSQSTTIRPYTRQAILL